MKACYLILMVLASLFTISSGAFGATNYVTTTGTGDGSSWANATSLTNALAIAGADDQIWIAEGTYYPGSARSDTFQLKSNVGLYGGFTTQMVDFAERDWTNYVTTLSGEIQQDAWNTNNSYHVVKGVDNATLDGFTITNGYADGTNPDERGAGMYNKSDSPIITNCTFSGNSASGTGGGMYNESSSPTIENCTFSGNSANQYGGGIFNNVNSSPTIENCTFSGNSASTYGGGMGNWNSSSPAIQNCTFSGNSAVNNGGGMHNESSSSPAIENCTFSGNSANQDGGGMGNGNNSSPTVTNCTFSDNSAAVYGGGMYNESSSPTLKNCTFSDNSTTITHGGGMCNYNNSASTIENCTFSGNSAANSGGGMYSQSSSPTLKNCTFSGNSAAAGFGGGMFNNISCTSIIENCLFSGNSANDGGGMCNWNNSFSTVTNCTFSNNSADQYGGGMCNGASSPTIGNCIFWTNSAAVSGQEIYSDGTCTSSVSYANYDPAGVSGSVNDGGGNINTNPLFVGGAGGTWSSDGVYDTASGKTVLTNSSASWTAGELIGKTVNPNTNQVLQFAVFTNAVNAITIWGDASALGTNQAPYRIHDFHLKSRGGRWMSLGWSMDMEHSPCIDAGDTNSVYSLEPEPNGGRINMGAYGNTIEASKTLPAGMIFYAY